VFYGVTVSGEWAWVGDYNGFLGVGWNKPAFYVEAVVCFVFDVFLVHPVVAGCFYKRLSSWLKQGFR